MCCHAEFNSVVGYWFLANDTNEMFSEMFPSYLSLNLITGRGGSIPPSVTFRQTDMVALGIRTVSFFPGLGGGWVTARDDMTASCYWKLFALKLFPYDSPDTGRG